MRLTKAGYQGIYLPDYGIAMDGTHPDAIYTFVTHAHADHMHRNRSIHTYASRPTLKLMALRGFKGEFTTLAFGSPLKTEKFTATLFPAGHILGSAMIYIETEDSSLLYTGDYRTPPSPATEGFEAPGQADYIITEATFGLPIYRWKSNEVLADEIRSFAMKTLDDGYTPIFLAYNLGKAQEIMHLVAPLNHPVMIHGTGFNLCSVYDEEGIELGNYQSYNHETCEGKILVCPSSALSNGFASNVIKKRIAYCSGWAALEARRTQLTVDKLIPISDHLDFYELINFCERLSPKKVWITHSPNPAVVKHFLDKRKINSSFLNLEMESDD